MDVSRYRKGCKALNKPFTVTLDADALARIRKLKESHGVIVSKWARDLILQHLPELERQVKD